MHQTERYVLGLLAFSVIGGGASAQGTPCWTYDYGTRQVASSNGVTPVIDLPFEFGMPGGGSTTRVQASTNGFVWLGPIGTPDNSPSIAGMLSEWPRIFAGWADLDCGTAVNPNNGVFVNTSDSTRTVFTWIGNDLEWGATDPDVVEMQVQLLNSGAFIIGHRRVDQYSGTDGSDRHAMLVGVSGGRGTWDPGEVDFSAGVVLPAARSTIYELFENPRRFAGDPRDIASISSLLFVPGGNGTYTVVNLDCGPFASGSARGSACPRDNGSLGVLFEHFPSGAPDLVGRSIRFTRLLNGDYRAELTPTFEWEGAYANRIDTDPWLWQQFNANDGMSVAKPLGFTTSYWDNDPTSDLYICSNGRVYLGNSPHIAPTPSASALASSACVLALYSDDLDCTSGNIPSGGGLYLDRFAAAGQTPARCVVTFDQIPRYSRSGPSNETLTAQAQFYANGDVLLSIAACNITHSGIVGFFRGNQTGDVSNTADSTDLSTALVAPGFVAEAPRRPMTHDADEFRFGFAPTARVSIPYGSLATVLHVGVDQTDVPLDAIGMTGCSAYTLTLTGTAAMSQSDRTATFSFGSVPNVQALSGITITTQVLSLVPGINPMHIATSNGWDSHVGH